MIFNRKKEYNYSGIENLILMQKVAKNYNNFLTSLVTNVIKKEQKIVDFGSGTAFFAQKIFHTLSLQNPLRTRMVEPIHCIEISENLFKYYKNRTDVILHKSLEEFNDNTVDCLYSFNVLEHIKNDTYYLNLMYQKLKKGGILILYLPAFMYLFSSLDKKVGHYRRYNKKNLIKKLNTNFQIITCQYVDFAGFFITLMYKIIGSKEGKINFLALWIFDKIIFPIGRIIDKITFGSICGKNILCVAIKKG